MLNIGEIFIYSVQYGLNLPSNDEAVDACVGNTVDGAANVSQFSQKSHTIVKASARRIEAKHLFLLTAYPIFQFLYFVFDVDIGKNQLPLNRQQTNVLIKLCDINFADV